jgi:6-phosphogluconolactonase (cycloisomerase 2 family)
MAVTQQNGTSGPSNNGLYVALQSTGVVELAFDPQKGVKDSLSVVSVNTKAGFMPGWLTLSGDKVYTINRMGYPGSESDSGSVSAFQRATAGSSETGLKLVDQLSSNGKGGVHCDVSPDGKVLAAANITASTLSIYPLSATGSIGKPTHVFDYNKSDPGPKEAHPHQALFDPSGKLLIVPLRTMDRVDIYSVDGPEQVVKVHSIPLPDLSGPRHVAFNPISPSKAYLYVLSEKDNSLRVFTIGYPSPASPALTVEFKQILSTLGKDVGRTPDEHKDLAGEIVVTNDGKFVYASNRNLTRSEFDTSAIYSVDSDPAHDDKHLTYLGEQDLAGKHPRMFALSKDKENKWLAISHQLSQNIAVFERDTVTGFLKELKGTIGMRVNHPHQPEIEKVTFAEDLSDAEKLTKENLKKGKTEGPMCVQWK